MEVRIHQCRSAVSPSGLPGLDFAINPYKGCAHSCAYCYAKDVTRFEPSLPWGAVVEVKAGIVQRLKKELDRGGPRGVYGVGTVTDPYQPLEKEYELTRGCLAMLRRHGARASVLTKSALVLRDLDILRGWEGAEVGMSIGSADRSVTDLIEPHAPPPERRFQALGKLSGEGVPAYLMAAPIIRGLTDSKGSVSEIVRLAGESGVRRIMWDKYNQKPVASARLAGVLASAGIVMGRCHTAAEVREIRAFFCAECARSGIELLDAF